MDGNKKIRGIVLAAITALSLNACKVQAPAYVGLYVDNKTSVTDTIDTVEVSMLILDAEKSPVPDTTFTTKNELPENVRQAVLLHKTVSDSSYQTQAMELLQAIADSVQQLRYQIIELQKQLAWIPDSITMLLNQVAELKKTEVLKTDTVFITKEIVTQFKGDSIHTDYETTELLQSRNDTIFSLRKRAYELQRQLTAMQTAAARMHQPTPVVREPAPVQPLTNKKTDQLTLQLFLAQNDTIQFLRNQLSNLQLKPHKSDTVYIDKVNKDIEPVNEFVTEQSVPDFQSLQDTILLLKARVLNLEKHTLPGMDTTATAIQDEKDVPLTSITDTTLIIAYYELGKIKPFEEEVILRQLKELCRKKNVMKITLSGYTDSSGNERINKEITNRRLNYFLEKINSWVTKDKVYFHNFGDAFASEKIVSEERKVEIRIFTD